jgi:phosphoglycolate phosphatase-like HAD superfamily hydrolase
MRTHLALRRSNELTRRAARRLPRRELRAAGSATLFNGVDQTLRWLHAEGVPILVVSDNSTRARLRTLLRQWREQPRRVRLRAQASLRDGRDEASQAPIDAALRHVNGFAQEAFFVGDSPGDMDAGRMAGVFTIGVCTGEIGERELREGGADHCIGSFAELLSFRHG